MSASGAYRQRDVRRRTQGRLGEPERKGPLVAALADSQIRLHALITREALEALSDASS